MDSIIKEGYAITKHTHTSYKDIDEITPTERKALLKLIVDDMSREAKIYQSMSNNKE